MPKLREILLPVICFCLLYWGIEQYERFIPVYRSILVTAMMLVAGSLLALCWVKGEAINPLHSQVALFWLVFFVLGVLSASFAIETQTAFGQLRLYFAAFLLGLGFRAWIGKPTRFMIIGFLLALCLAHVFILIVVIGYASGLVSDTLNSAVLVPYHGNVRHVAHHGMTAACAGLAIFIIGGRLRLAGYLLGAIATFGLVFLGQRGGLLGLGFFVAVSAFLLPTHRKKIIITGLLTVVLSLGLTYSLDSFGIKNRFSGSIIERAKTQGADVLTNTSGRIAVWTSSVELALERPLLGNGPDGFRTSKTGRSYVGIVQSHNMFFQTLVEFGFPGLVLVTLFTYQVLRKAFGDLIRAKRNACINPNAVFLFGILIGFFAMSLVEGLFYHSIPLMIISMTGPLALATNAESTGMI